jgi:hypothetical protein
MVAGEGAAVEIGRDGLVLETSGEVAATGTFGAFSRRYPIPNTRHGSAVFFSSRSSSFL